MCAETQKYSHLIEAVFGNLGIPYFIDSDMPVTDHPIILTVLGIFDIIEENWSYESVFRYLRTGFVFDENGKEYDREKIDKLENYVLCHGIRGKSRWFSEWKKETPGVFDSIIAENKKTDENIDEINEIRKSVCAPFEKFYSFGKGSARELAEALFGFLCDINLYSGVNAESKKLRAAGLTDAAERMKEIWNLLMETINQTVVIMGEESCSRQNYARFLKEGLSAAKLKIIPPAPDVVSIGASDRNSSARPKIMIFMGAVSGTMPAEVHTRSIFTDRERVYLEEKGIENAGTSQEKTKREEFKFFRAVSSAGEKLYFSYPTSNSNGEAQMPAAFIKNLYKLFPGLSISDDIIDQKPKEVNNPRDAFLYIMRAVSDNAMRENAHLLARFYKGNEYLSSRLPMVARAMEYKKNQPRLTLESARLLYNDYHSYSVSKINAYAACPFSYYLKYGLKVREQQVWQIQKFDIGSLLHWAVCEYCKEADGDAETFEETKKRWHELTDKKSLEIIDKLVDEISQRVLTGLNRDKEKIFYLIERLRKILIRSTDIIRLSLTKGEYSAVCYEEKFSVDISWNEKKVGINGTIDRIDAAENIGSGELALRIIDYKSGSKKFDVVAISNREDMQLAVYAIAATELYKKGALGHAAKGLQPAVRGVLYNKLRSDLVPCKENDICNIDSVIRNSMKPDGVIIVDDGNEISAAVQMDNDIENGGTSSFLKLAINSKGDALNKNSSSYMMSDKFRILTDYVRKTVVNLDEEIFSGRIDILPGKIKNACSYCKYKEICLYDAGTDGCKKEITNTNAAWSYMETEVDGNAEKRMDE